MTSTRTNAVGHLTNSDARFLLAEVIALRSQLEAVKAAVNEAWITRSKHDHPERVAPGPLGPDSYYAGVFHACALVKDALRPVTVDPVGLS